MSSRTTFVIREITAGMLEEDAYTQVHSELVGGVVLVGLLVRLLLFYSTTLLVFKRGTERHRKRSWWGLSLLTLLGLGAIEALIDFQILRHALDELTLQDHFWRVMGQNMIYHVFIWLSALGYVFGREWWSHEKTQRSMREEKLKSELSYLKSQVNPHLLFNTLNNLFALAKKHEQAEVAEGVSKLSDLMRYSLYHTQVDRVALNKEIEYIDTLIEIQRLRIDEEDDTVIRFEHKGPIASFRIAPLLLAPFVENAFKHGIDFKETSVVSVVLEVDEHGHLLFVVKNKVFEVERSADEASGIGLANVKRQLELLYPERHQLEIENNGKLYQVRLSIDLEDKA